MTDGSLLRELDIIQHPVRGDIGFVCQVNVLRPSTLHVDLAEVELVQSIIILRRVVREDGDLWSLQDTVKEQLLLITVREVRDDLTLALIQDGHGPLLAVR